ncbi:MAG: hypothetical protein B6244_00330 [Candidatus Cloacimonetes bacterium 4572_55]|nr:MAG: hypothetical protein B6244_00330 [Candidatus Cloacimonetes bacterium 4572_55]
MTRSNPLFTPHKLNYAMGNRPDVDCILCAIGAGDKRVKNLSVFHNDRFIVSLNLYPYNPGHLLIFPIAHYVDIRELSSEEEKWLQRMQRLSLTVLDELYQPRGYNIGYNIGRTAGASIQHLHLHIVPRFGNEIGFLDVVSGTRVIVEDPGQTREQMKNTFARVVRQTQLQK